MPWQCRGITSQFVTNEMEVEEISPISSSSSASSSCSSSSSSSRKQTFSQASLPRFGFAFRSSACCSSCWCWCWCWCSCFFFCCCCWCCLFLLWWCFSCLPFFWLLSSASQSTFIGGVEYIDRACPFHRSRIAHRAGTFLGLFWSLQEIESIFSPHFVDSKTIAYLRSAMNDYHFSKIMTLASYISPALHVLMDY